MDHKNILNLVHRCTFEGHTSMVFALCKGLRYDEIMSTGADGMVINWLPSPDEPEGKVIAMTNETNVCLFRDEEADLLMIGTLSGQLFVIHLGHHQLLAKKKLTAGGIFAITKNEIGYFFVGDNGCLSHFGLEDFKLKRLLQLSNSRCRAICQHNDMFYVGTSEGQIHCIDPFRMKQTLASSIVHQGSVFELVAFDDIVFSVGKDGRIIKWDKNLVKVDDIQAHNSTINSCVLIKDPGLLVTGCRDGSIRIWDAYTLELLKVIDVFLHQGHLRSVNCLSWDDHNAALFSGSDDRKVKYWEIN